MRNHNANRPRARRHGASKAKPKVYRTPERILSAAEFQAQGTSAAAVLSIANLHAPRAADVLRKTAIELARMTGEPLGRGLTQGGAKPANDNRTPVRRAA